MLTDVPTEPEVGERLVIPGVTVKEAVPLTPFTITFTVAFVGLVGAIGTGATIDVSLQLLGVAAVPLNVTVLVPCVDPKFVPVMVTDVPFGPEPGDTLLMVGATLKETPLLATPPTVTTTLPVVAPLGTGATMEVALQLEGVAKVPLNVTVLVP